MMAAPTGTSGRHTSTTASAVPGPKLMLMPMRSSPAKRSTTANTVTVRVSDSVM